MFLQFAFWFHFKEFPEVFPQETIQQASATVYVNPSNITANTGQNFTVNIDISDVYDLYGWEFKFGWDITLLDCLKVVEGNFLKSGGSTFFTYKVNSTAGTLIADCTLLGNVSGVTGGGTLANITFYVKNVGECPLDLYDVILVDSLEQQIQSQPIDGYGYFTAEHDIAITDVKVSQTSILQGETANINVSIQNIGSFTETLNVTIYANSTTISELSTSLNASSAKKISIIWNTTSFKVGTYIVYAYANPVPGEVNTANNNKTADTPITILYPGHDIAIEKITPSKTVVCQDTCMFISTMLRNYGAYNETFNILIYANETIIQNKTITLEAGKSITLTSMWNASGLTKGNYTLSAYIKPVPGETETQNNQLVDGYLFISLKGDITGVVPQVPDGKVDMRDVAMVAKAFGSSSGDSRWNPNADITGLTAGVPDGQIDMRDIAFVARNFGAIDP